MSDKWSCKFGPKWHSSDKSIDSDSDIGWVEIQDDAGNTVAMVTDEGGGLMIQSADREMERRAFLLTAAPDMYEELQCLASQFQCECGHKSCSIEAQRRDIEAVLAKARGES